MRVGTIAGDLQRICALQLLRNNKKELFFGAYKNELNKPTVYINSRTVTFLRNSEFSIFYSGNSNQFKFEISNLE
jgi:hypothetical protein